MLTRRQLIKAGLAGSVLLAGAAWWAAPPGDRPVPATAHEVLSARDAMLVGVLAPAMLGLPGVDVAAVVRGVDAALAALPDATRREVRQLFDLLENPWGRRWLAGVAEPWGEAPATAVAAFLGRWQQSRFALLRSGYQGLHALITAAWYGNPASWPALHYQRPAHVLAVLP